MVPKTLEKKLEKHMDLLISRYPMLDSIKQDIIDAYLIMQECYENDHKLLIAGNGGSAADAEHIAGELMKRFKILRSVPTEFAQQLYGFGRKGDVFLGISTSGNSKNVMNATVVARALGIKVIGLTGARGGELAEVADVAIRVPETETYMIQELHLPVYHCLCLMLEDYFFGN